MKKNRKRAVSIALSLVLAMTAVNITGCGKKADSTNGELNLFIWTEYVPDEVIKDFEKEYGIKVNVSTFSSNEDMLAKVKSEDEGTYDIVQPSDYMVESMIAQGMLEKLDQDALTNLSNIGSQYLDPAYDPGNVYSVPYQGGVAAIAVNTDKVTTDIKGYADLFDPSLKGQIVALIKPLFEAGREKVGKKGVVREKSTHIEVVTMILDYASTHGFHVLDLTFSPIKGPEGNIEYLVQLEKCEEPGDINEKIQIEKIVDEAFGNLAKKE